MCERILAEHKESSKLQNSDPQSDCVDSEFSESEVNVLPKFGHSNDLSDDDDLHDTGEGGKPASDLSIGSK